MRKTKPIFLILLLLLAVSCSGRHPADILAPAVMTGTDVYQGLEETLVQLHDAGSPTITANWQQISNVRWKASAAFRTAWKAWYALSQVNNPQNQQELNQALVALASLLSELLNFIPTSDPNFETLKIGVDELKEQANGNN
ncbi:hypothetical protein L0152_07170 [bacterium]|nr:hypothetical protein [bacterium]